MPAPLRLNERTLRALDLAVLRRVFIDLGLARDGRMKRRPRTGYVGDETLEAARWLFANRHRDHLFSPNRICERLDIDPMKLAAGVFRSLSKERQIAICFGLRHYRQSLLPSLTRLDKPR